MKKFYTLLSVALAGTMMVSAGVRATEAKPAAALEAKAISTKTFDATPVKAEKKEVALKAPAKAEAADVAAITGEYLFKSYARDFDSNTAYWMNMSVPYVEVNEDNSVVIEGFWFRTVVLNATYNPENSTITIPYTEAATVPTTTGNVDIHFYVVDFATVTAQDLVLTVDAANRTLYWEPAVTDDGYYAETLLVSAVGINDGSRIYDQMYDCSLNQINAIMSWAALDENGDPVYDENGEPDYESTYVYAAKEDTNLIVDNFLDYSVLKGAAGCFGRPVVFAIDNEAQTITATNQTMTWSFSDGDIVCKVCGVDGEYFNYDNPSLTFVGDEATLESGITVTDFYTEAVGILFELDGDLYGKDFYDVELLLLEPLFSGDSGIADVIANDNSNAPVEYFNLQGVKVENPAAGLYIRRQGNKATKVLVK